MRKNSGIYKTLKAFVEIANELYEILPGHITMYEALGHTKKRFNQDLRRLEKRGYVKNKSGKLLITDKGRLEAFEKIDTQSKKWDGKWRFVIFDIPFDRKKLREMFRKKIKEMGFKQYQKSVWVLPFEINEYINLLIDEYRANKYVKLITAEEISDDKIWKKKFRINR